MSLHPKPARPATASRSLIALILRSPAFILHQLSYDLRSGLLFRPGTITAALALSALLTVELDALPALRTFLAEHAPGLFRGDPGAAQTLLATIAGSMMTVVSIVYSILVMMLTLASMQFSPRVLASLLRDQKSQNTLGIFIGTFTYALLILENVRSSPDPFVPILGVSGAILLALTCLASLLYFLHHVAQGIQANYLIDRLAGETEEVIDANFPERWPEDDTAENTIEVPAPPLEATAVTSLASGYVQLIDLAALKRLAQKEGLQIYLLKGPGEFATEGLPLAAVAPPEKLNPDTQWVLQEAFDLGPVRTMQDDVEFGVRQIVDIGLKAISPAVNDPSTAVTCIDQLGRLLCRLATRREQPPIHYFPESGGLLVQRQASFLSVLDLAFNQLRQYGRTDMAVSLRLVRVLGEVAGLCRGKASLERLREQARLIATEARRSFTGADLVEFEERLSHLETLLEGRLTR